MAHSPTFEALDQLSAEVLPERTMMQVVSPGAAAGGGAGCVFNSCSVVTQPAPNLLSVLGLGVPVQTAVTCVPAGIGVT